MDPEEQKPQAAHVDEKSTSVGTDGGDHPVVDNETGRNLRRIDKRVMPVVSIDISPAYHLERTALIMHAALLHLCPAVLRQGAP